jgi:mRNA-degrading endonuclease RelE of RelBE toxin-antitoxin system
MVRIRISETALKQYSALPPALKQKVDKQFEYLLSDIRHPSLHAKKYQGADDLWQARIDKDWRFYFFIVSPHYVIVSVIKHPK